MFGRVVIQYATNCEVSEIAAKIGLFGRKKQVGGTRGHLFLVAHFALSTIITTNMSITSRATDDSFVPLSSRISSRYPPTGRPTTTATSVAGQDIVCAISESRGISSIVGLAFVNLATAEVVLSQICDSQTYVKTVTKIGVFEPSEILFMNTVKESKLRYIIQENIPGSIFTFLDRKYWRDKTGHEYLDRLAFPDELDSLKVTLGGNFFAACCFAAVCLLAEAIGRGIIE